MENKLSRTIKQNPLLAFFMLTYIIGWTPYTLRHTAAESISMGIVNFSPAIAGIIVLGLTQGKEGLQALFGSLFRWKVKIKWYLIALFAPILLEVLAYVVQRIVGNIDSTRQLGDFFRIFQTQLPVVLAFLFFLVILTAGEELGWRGFALPRLIKRFGAFWASVLLGIFWGIWHLPMYWLPGSNQYGIPFFGYVLACIGYSFIYTCLYRGSGGSVLLACVYHGASNLVLNFGHILFPEVISNLYISLIAVALTALIVVLVSGKQILKPEKAQVYAIGTY
ncbi:MAG: CPBP family intramembrane metalloprotease [Anaerolineaceae bacterium]|nr:CPBP family intramembrane metalloprotease [Anaerolineaceae bacterium]